jgi:enoyl-CoA hydratase
MIRDGGMVTRRALSMTVRIETEGAVWTIIHSCPVARPVARNPMDPESALAVYEAFQSFDADESARVAVFWGEGRAFCASWDLKHAAALGSSEALAIGHCEYVVPMGPSRQKAEALADQ